MICSSSNQGVAEVQGRGPFKGREGRRNLRLFLGLFRKCFTEHDKKATIKNKRSLCHDLTLLRNSGHKEKKAIFDKEKEDRHFYV